MTVRIALTTLVLLALAAPAAAREVPRGFYGVTWDGWVREASPAVQAKGWRKLAANGAESGRAVFSWAQSQPERGAAFDFARSDRVVEDASRRGVHLLPVVMDTPEWARERPGDWWPERRSDYGAYVRALVERYGPRGSFWAENAGVPKRPLRYWQILNEPEYSAEYGPLLRTAYRAIKRLDPGAKVVLAGLTGTVRGTPWGVLRHQYRQGGIRRWFDVAAIHMYTGEPENVVEGVRRFRRVMAQHGDRRKPIWLTEFGITASKGRTQAPRSQRTLRTTDKGMAAFLRKSYRLLVAARRDVGLRRAYWYTWSSSYQRGGGIFGFAGLTRFVDGRFEAKPALRAYRESARRDSR